jgi:hypothetical protein
VGVFARGMTWRAFPPTSLRTQFKLHKFLRKSNLRAHLRHVFGGDEAEQVEERKVPHDVVFVRVSGQKVTLHEPQC